VEVSSRSRGGKGPGSFPLPVPCAVGANDAGRRLDRVLRKALPALPLSALHRALRKGRILLDGRPATADTRVSEGQIITVPAEGDETRHEKAPDEIPAPRARRSPPFPPLAILYESPDLLALNKPPGLETHGTHSLATQAAAYLDGKIAPSLSFRPGPLHRLDKPTSGIVLFGKSLAGSRCVSELLRSGALTKTYLALLDGILSAEQTWDFYLYRDKIMKKSFVISEGDPRFPLAKRAVSIACPLATGGAPPRTLAKIEIHTGLTHQIRASAARAGHPLSGDKKYGSRTRPDYPESAFFLHARRLDFPAPSRIPLPPFLEAPPPGSVPDFSR
jgi:23S rRNA pseudouridine955/2504/2580 synthase